MTHALVSTWWIAARAFRQGTLTRRGVLALVLLLATITLPNALTAWLTAPGRVDPAQLRPQQVQALVAVYGQDVASALQGCPSPLQTAAMVTMVLLPLIVLVLGYDGVAGSVFSGNVRFEAVRTPRPALIAGRALGLWTTVAAFLTMTHLGIWIAVIAFSPMAPAVLVVKWGAALVGVCIVAAAAYVALIVAVGTFFRRPGHVLTFGLLVLFLLWFARKWAFVSEGAAAWTLPASNHAALLALGADVWQATARIVVWSVAALVIAMISFSVKEL